MAICRECERQNACSACQGREGKRDGVHTALTSVRWKDEKVKGCDGREKAVVWRGQRCGELQKHCCEKITPETAPARS
jgi:hypothetical protein